MDIKEIQKEMMLDCGIIAIVRSDSDKELVSTIEAIYKGGISCIEVTMTTPGAIDAIKETSRVFKGKDVVVGVGSVLDAATARTAILNGAEFVVAPITDTETIRMCRRCNKIVVPGAFTPTEIVKAWEDGADFVKGVSCKHRGVSLIKALKAPLPHIPLVPTGGVTVENIKDFFEAGASMVGIGAHIADKDMIKKGMFSEIENNAKRFKDALEKYKKGR